MKNLIPIFLLFLFSFVANAQTIRRVNGTPGITDTNVYTSVQAAHDVSVDGDIIYLEPANSSIEYGQVTVNRRITIIGVGNNLSQIPTGSPFDKREVSILGITLGNGSMGSKIMGLVARFITVTDSNCRIERCAVDNIYLGTNYSTSGDNTIILNNKIGGINPGQVNAHRVTGCQIFNNIITYEIISLSSANITRNTFYTNRSFVQVSESNISANIFDIRSLASGSTYSIIDFSNSPGNTISNNLCTQVSGLPSNNGNINNIDPSTVFKVANPWTENPFLEINLELSPTSPALTVGPSNTPIGAFSGATPFIPFGLPNIPIITDFSINGIGNVNSPLQINVKARSNN